MDNAATPVTHSGPSPEFVKKIETDIRQSGFPLELHVLNICSKTNTGRMPSIRYEHLGDLREIDLLAFFETIDVDPKGTQIVQHTSTDLIIECKKSHDKPWVFFSSEAFVDSDLTPFLKYLSDFDFYFKSKHLPSLLAQIFPHIRHGHYAAVTVPKCISYYEAFRNTSGSEIYRAIDSVITYLTYRQLSRKKLRQEYGNFSEFYLPVVVLDGPLFEASVNQAGDIQVHARTHLQLRTWHREDIYVVDVVTRNYFEQFFDQVQTFHKQLVSGIRATKFPSDLKARVKARLKELWESPDPWVRDMLLMSIEPAPPRSHSQRRPRRKKNKKA